MTSQDAALQLTDWRRRTGELYAAVRATPDPQAAHARWRAGRDELFCTHPQSPLPAGDPLRADGLGYWPYDAGLRFERALIPADRAEDLTIPTGGEETTELSLLGHILLPGPIAARVDVWWMQQYGGGLFIPLRDGTSGDTSYGGGRYLLDTAKGADLGAGRRDGTIVVDLNFLYHPSCRYDQAWVCPLAPRGNTIAAPVRAGEIL